MPKLQEKPTQIFLFTSLLITIIGYCFVYSAGSYWGEVHYEDSLPFFWKQVMYGTLGMLSAWVIVKLPFITNRKFWLYAYIASIFLLFAVYIPGLGIVRNGSQSWIEIAGFSLQPAEFVKISVIGFLACVLAGVKNDKKKRYVGPILICLIPAGIILVQPDFGTAFLLIVGGFSLLFIAGFPMRFFISIGTLGVLALVGLIVSAPYRLKRISAFLDPWEDPLNSGFQGIQSLLAIGPAGLFGHGFGQSRQKFLYLPEPQNDFIFSIIVEEMGFFGAAILIGLFILFLYTGFRLAILAPTRIGFYAIAGLQSMIGFQIFLNIGVVIGLFPVTGVTLPFISYGGSSLLSIWLVVGLILRFSKD
ncbi:putative lipid II flippase FtsW [Paenisporosarcina sp. TG20]|uniref:putative lipid II flippase FtsW n=1 Tax=Paenisporosarcina sp. TG20 TaxID=1211706 RepID=UPI00031627FA|nr:putative lipid II flippase FtsW [Paenisporosarcina sp. TG20]